MQALYERQTGQKLDYDEAVEEIVNNAMFSVDIKSTEFETFIKEHTTLAQRILDAIYELLRDLSAFFKTVTGIKEVETLRGDLEYMQEVAERVEEILGKAQKNSTTAERGVRYLIVEDKQGYYVDINRDQDIFENISEQQSISIINKYMRKHFRGKVFPLSDERRAYVGTVGVNEYSHPARKNLNKDLYMDKLRAGTELDNLLAVSVFDEHEEDNGHHPEAVGGWDNYKTVYKVGERIYEGVVRIENRANGREFKDITKIKEISRNAGQSAEAPADAEISTNSIPDNSEKSNTKKLVLDRDYMQAARNGDEEKAAEYVEQAAKEHGAYAKSNGTPVVFYHQTDKDFNVFNTLHEKSGKYDPETPTGIFIKPHSRDIGFPGKKQMPLFAFINIPLVFKDRTEAVKYYFNNIPGYKESYQKSERINKEFSKKADDFLSERRELRVKYRNEGKISKQEYEKLIAQHRQKTDKMFDEWAQESQRAQKEAKKILTEFFSISNYDSVIIEHDEGSFGRSTETFIVFDSSQVKSADPITYDNNGEIIPLSERFSDSKDIRYSVKDVEQHKVAQYKIVEQYNPAPDDMLLWIRSPKDIKTFEEAAVSDGFSAFEEGITPDCTAEMMREALKTGYITVYSSYPIEKGTFVTPSKMESESYAGRGNKTYSKRVKITDVAWIDAVEGQYAPVENEDVRYSVPDTFMNEEQKKEVLDSFGITKPNDYRHVQIQVFETLTREGFFDETGRRIETNAESGMKVEINESGIEESFSTKNYRNISRNLKYLKLATIRKVPEIIIDGKLVTDDEENYHNPQSTVKYAYIEGETEVYGVPYKVKISVRKSLQKNKFWVHQISVAEKKNVAFDLPAGEISKTGYRAESDNDRLSQSGANVKKLVYDTAIIDTIREQEAELVQVCRSTRRKPAAETVREPPFWRVALLLFIYLFFLFGGFQKLVAQCCEGGACKRGDNKNPKGCERLCIAGNGGDQGGADTSCRVNRSAGKPDTQNMHKGKC